MPSSYFAHSAAETGVAAEPLREHLELVGDHAASSAEAFGAAAEARFAGLLHDAGKADEQFNRRLRGEASGLDHWTPGAALALHLGREHGIAAALAIQGHHVGLGCATKSSLKQLYRMEIPSGRTLTIDDRDLLLERLAGEGVQLPQPDGSVYSQGSPPTAGLLDVRMLFSALVDADFLETEAHFQRGPDGKRQYRPPAPDLDPAAAMEILNQELEGLAEKNRERSSPEVQGLRSDLLDACRQAASSQTGVFTLTAPTGAGKTLSMLAFALAHAAQHGLRRIVIAVPYLSILEQTAQVYRDLLEPVFGSGYVLEHHSLAGTRKGEPGDDEQGGPAEALRRRQAENWDVPLVLTTSVQLLESLFAHRNSSCRKLHRLARSVVLFDEVQTLPRPLAVATLAALSHLGERYGASVVFSTATQPAFESLHLAVQPWAASGWQPREIVPPGLGLYDRLRRVSADWRVGDWRPEDRLSWGRLVEELLEEPQVLCILNLKRHARQVAGWLQDRSADGLFHLSTSMCPAHRQKILADVRLRLKQGLPCRLVSTQCVEAGVDIDFPVVYRAFAPLDAIAQAAGRCNRNGVLPDLGRLVIFLPDERHQNAFPGNDYRQAADVTQEVLMGLSRERWDLQDPQLYRTWYRRLYDVAGLGDGGRKRQRELEEAMTGLDFAETARLYRLIRDDTVQVVVPWDRDRYDELWRDSEKTPWITADWMRAAQIHSVSVFSSQRQEYRNNLIPAPLGAHLPEQESDDWFFLQDPNLYDPDTGLGEATSGTFA